MNSVKLQDTKLIYRNLLHFYILSERKIPFTVSSKVIQRINLTKVKDLYSRMNEIDDTNKWKDVWCSWTEEFC